MFYVTSAEVATKKKEQKVPKKTNIKQNVMKYVRVCVLNHICRASIETKREKFPTNKITLECVYVCGCMSITSRFLSSNCQENFRKENVTKKNCEVDSVFG